MKKAMLILGLLALAPLAVWSEPAVNDITLGELLMGESISAEDMEGHVVAVEFTGLN